MSNGTLFYVFGIALAVSAVVVSLIGLRLKDFPGRFAPLVALWFVALVGSATTFAVLHARDEEAAKAAELATAGEEISKEESSSPVPSEAKTGGAPEGQSNAKGPGQTLRLSASPTQIAFSTTKLTSKPGKVTVDFDNPAPIEHDVAIEQNGKIVAQSELVTKGKTSVSADLKPGTYTFLCTVPGHAEAGMEGTLTVK